MNNGSPEQAELIQNAIKQGSLEQLSQVVAIVHETGALEYTKNQAAAHTDKAIEQLQQLPDNQYRQAMVDLAEFAIGRNH